MRGDPRAYLLDAAHAVAAIKQFAANFTFSEYRKNALVQSAVERQFITLGESLNAVSGGDPEKARSVTDLILVIDFRNKMAHDYFHIDHAIVWCAISERIPAIQADIAEVQDKLKPKSGNGCD